MSATSNFDEKAIIGQGGQGTVYKAYDLHPLYNPVAIKRCKGFDESRRKEFGQELVILSRVKDENIVKLVGCCLQLEVPVLVYEFVPNNTLHHLIHEQSNPSNRTLGIRLKIAAESAKAIAHLRSQDQPIFHGDVKSTNILIGENFVAKVSDFGCSMIRTTDENPNVVKGTIGYLDPEYLLAYELTGKSDLYSFGVVLLELLTRRKPLSRKKENLSTMVQGTAVNPLSREKESLASVFQEAVKEGKLDRLIDREIAHQENMELARQVAELAGQCLLMAGERRPTMSQVAEELRRLVAGTLVHHRAGALEGGSRIMVYGGRSDEDASDYYTGGDGTDYYSIKKRASMSIEVPR